MTGLTRKRRIDVAARESRRGVRVGVVRIDSQPFQRAGQEVQTVLERELRTPERRAVAVAGLRHLVLVAERILVDDIRIDVVVQPLVEDAAGHDADGAEVAFDEEIEIIGDRRLECRIAAFDLQILLETS